MGNSPQDAEMPPIRHFRGNDRRVHDGMTPPPYLTHEGLVYTDRRRHFDRRANWLRQFSLEIIDPPKQQES